VQDVPLTAAASTPQRGIVRIPCMWAPPAAGPLAQICRRRNERGQPALDIHVPVQIHQIVARPAFRCWPVLTAVGLQTGCLLPDRTLEDRLQCPLATDGDVSDMLIHLRQGGTRLLDHAWPIASNLLPVPSRGMDRKQVADRIGLCVR
jgi:hypothetical protein